MKFKTAIAAAAVLAAGAAHAAIDSSNNADLFLAVFDTNNVASYVLDLNTTIPSFNAASGNYSFSVDSAYSTFLATAGLDASTLRYGVYAVDNQGSKTVKDDIKLFSTATTGLSIAVKNNSALGTGLANVVLNANNFNANTSTVAVAGTSAYANPATFNELSQALVNGATTSNALGTASDFYMFGVSNITGTKPADTVKLAGTWNFNGSVLSYTTATTPAVPEASTYAMLLAGLAAIGFVARRRAV